LAGVEKKEGPGAVSVLAHPRAEAGLAEEGGLLVAGDARDGQVEPVESLRIGATEVARAVADLGQQSRRHSKKRAQLRVPVESVDVEEQGAAGVAGLSEVLSAASQPSHQPRIDGPEGQRSNLRSALDLGVGLQQPAQLGGREVGVEEQAGAVANHRLKAVVLEATADVDAAPALPHDRRGDRPQGGAVPHHEGLTLVGDPDPGQRQARWLAGEDLGGAVQHRLPDLLGIVLDPARLGEMLGDLAVCLSPDGATLVDQ